MRSWRASALVFGSSAAVLMIEIIAGRLMAPYVGVSIETFTGIIGTVLAGIAIGAAVGGSISDSRDPRRLIGPALVLGGALTWAALPILRLLGPTMGPGPVAIVALTSAAFLAPCAVLSAIAPMVAKLRLGTLDETGSVVGGLSAAGTFGALVGTFLTGFVLVAALPSRPVVIVIGAILIVIGVLTMWRLGRTWPSGAMVAGMIVAALGALVLPPPCERETAYFCVRVVEDEDRASGRSLILDRTLHAYADLDDPTHLGLRYTRLFADVAATLPGGSLDVLHLGGGGFTVPQYLAELRPGSEQVVFEIDPELIEVAVESLGFERRPDIEVRTGDGRLGFADLDDDSLDLVIGDAFASTSVPWHLTTLEVMEEIDRVLRPGGTYVMNVIDGGDSRYARAQLATLAAQFEHVMALLPTDGVPDDRAVNQVLVASDRVIGTPAPAEEDGVVLEGDELNRYVGDAPVLTDDFAPVDQLLLR